MNIQIFGTKKCNDTKKAQRFYVRYPGLWIDHALDEKVAPQPETDNYLTLEADKNRLVIKCFLPDGQEIDQTVVEKNYEEKLAPVIVSNRA